MRTLAAFEGTSRSAIFLFATLLQFHLAANASGLARSHNLQYYARMSDDTQPTERDGLILIAVVDETYGITEDEAWEREREAYRCQLELEFGMPFSDADIGPGASLPAFVTLLQGTASIPLWVLLSGAFFLGKPLHENLKAWCDMAATIRSFFKRPVYLNRQGAAALAVEAVLDAMGGLPGAIRLTGYRTLHVADEADISTLPSYDQIEEALPTLFLGFIRHIFEIEADGVSFHVTVDGRSVSALRLN